ncbi:peptidase G2 autoproteolytic cleavage domain-containing protein [Inediibacterium massiliense]|uniref:peptidase G2 autoproteolytic cleavage domain-containing protein n=1 Tax=Inediibacterium massiliense TaxID=1658111 RepID=UPI0006B6325C|nr:peptidase G2 autoproteolytic cleavage domain-containing protein [Inediibacterium massiliense]
MARQGISKRSYIERNSKKAQDQQGAATEANGPYSHSEGIQSIANGDGSHAEGILTKADGAASHAEGFCTHASGEGAHIEGQFGMAKGKASHGEGQLSIAYGESSHAEGQSTKANGAASHSQGTETIVDGNSAHGEGWHTQAEGFASHAQGIESIAKGDGSHAQGWGTKATGICSHSQGMKTSAEGRYSHAQGDETIAKGTCSHAQGYKTTASGMYSHAQGKGTNTNYFCGTHIMGKYGDADAPYSWYIANGISEQIKGIGGKIVGQTGNMDIDGTYGSFYNGYGEMFETIDGKGIDIGYFVTLEGRKIRTANHQDDYILGVTTKNLAVIGGHKELRWRNKYTTDEWGNVQYENTWIAPDQGGNNSYEIIPIVNKQWDENKEYIPRRNREEWIYVGLLGQILVRDDGTCKIDGYCKVNQDGIATNASVGYRVLERISLNQILILLR